MIAACYLRKSNDQGDRSEDVKSVTVQRDEVTRYIEKQGWTLGPVFEDDGITGATFTGRPGLQALLGALKPAPTFQRLVVVEQSRIGRETLDTLMVIRQIERAGVSIWSVRGGRQITMKNDAGEILAMIESWRDTSERRKTAPRVRAAARNRHATGYVVGGKTYGYSNVRLGDKQPVRREIDPAQALVVKRIFEMTANGFGLAKIRAKLNAENIPASMRYTPETIKKRLAEGKSVEQGRWTPTGVREVLHRRDYVGEIITNRVQRAWDEENQREIRVPQPESEWQIRKDESLRIVSDELWAAAHARVKQTASAFLRKGSRLVGQVESTKGLYFLSGFLACGAEVPEPRAHGLVGVRQDGAEYPICGEPLIATRRGRNLTPGYICRGHRERQSCSNTTAVPMAELHGAVVSSLRETFSEETFVRHLESIANDTEARAQREAERAAILACLPTLAATEQRLVKRIATVEDDDLVAALKSEWQSAKAEREQAERRLQELEGIERDLKADREAVEALRSTWKNWQAILDEAQPTTDAAVDRLAAEANQKARQILRKVLVGPIVVTPRDKVDGEARTWSFAGHSRFDGVLSGGLTRGEIAVVHRGPLSPGLHPIGGGSDADPRTVASGLRSSDMAPHTPHTLVTPRRSRCAPR